jgi:predicted nucleotidyltransferase
MTRDDILATIRANEAELRKLQVNELALFGSFARGEETETSDIDFYVEFDSKTFDNYMGVRRLLERLFPRKIDLVIKSGIRPRLRDNILSEAIRGVTRTSTSKTSSPLAGRSSSTPPA